MEEYKENFSFNERVDVISKKQNSVIEGRIHSVRGPILGILLEKGKQEVFKLSDKLVLKQWRPGRPFQKFNRLDIRSKSNKLIYEGFITNLNENSIDVFYNMGTESVQDRYYKNEFQNNIYPVGIFSSKFNPNIHSGSEVNCILYPKRKLFDPSIEFNNHFEENVKEKFNIYKIQGDGNCLYRSLAHQLYGEEELYDIVKEAILDYLILEKDFFSQFIPNGNERFDEYINMKRMNGVWGDDVEIQAFSELYNRIVNIYAGSLKPLKTFHEDEKNNLRNERMKCEISNDNNNNNKETGIKGYVNISYHGKAHYNSLIDVDIGKFKENLLLMKPGEYEAKVLEDIKERKKNEKQEKESNTHLDLASLSNDITNLLISEKCELEKNTSNFNSKYSSEDIKLMFSRDKFLCNQQQQSNIDDLLSKKHKEIIKESEDNHENDDIADENDDDEGNENNKSIENDSTNIKLSINENNNKFNAKLEEEINQAVINQTEANYQEDELLKSVLEESRKEYNDINYNNDSEYRNYNFNNDVYYINDSSSNNKPSKDRESVNFILEMGFNIEEATIALTAVGNDPDLMLQYLYSMNHY